MYKNEMEMKHVAFPRSLKTGIVVVVCLNLLVFAVLGISIDAMSENAVENIGTAYMDGMNEQVSLHFETIIDLRLTMAESIARIAVDEKSGSYGTKEDIEYGARARHFLCAFLYSADGRIEMIYGDPVTLNYPDLFLASVQKGERKTASAVCGSGEDVILFGVPCKYPMSDGTESLAIVVGLSSAYMSEVLFLDSDSSLAYSFVIRRDGTFVARSDDAVHSTYFDRLYSIFEGQKEAADFYIRQLTEAMDAGKDYSVILKDGASRWHLHCTGLPYCDWYLVTVLPFDKLDQTILGMSSRWLTIVYAASFAAIAMLLILFFQYLKVYRNQVAELRRMNVEMDAARKEAEHANAAKQEFLSSMSHDIRTPMNAIIGMTSLATNSAGSPEQIQEYLRKIALSSKHLLGLINDVLDISKIESGKMTLNVEPVSLREVMDSIINIIQPQIKAKNQQFTAAAYEMIAEDVCCDSVRLNQVLINLLGNAVKFTPEKGSVQVSVYQEALPEDTFCVRTHFLVSDTGIGMSREYQKVIFDSFSREDNTRVQKTEGSGLGMAITKYIVDAMGGSISVRSEQGQGSEFHVILDLAKAASPAADGPLPSWNVLVVDGDQRLCASAAKALESLGVRAEWRLSGGEALELIRERRRDDAYQAVLLSWRLPDMDGLEAVRAIRADAGTDAPFLLLASCDQSGMEAAARDAGASGTISGPLFRSVLLDALKGLSGAPDRAAPAPREEASLELKGKHVLVAEDNELNWEVASELLSVLEMDLEWVENGRQCVEKFQSAPEGYYDAILMDVRMPVMDGYAATAAIRKLERSDAGVPIIAMTADAFSEDIQRCLECGMDDHLAKPIDMQAVARKLKKYLK